MDLQRVCSKEAELRLTPKALDTHFFLISVNYILLILRKIWQTLFEVMELTSLEIFKTDPDLVLSNQLKETLP